MGVTAIPAYRVVKKFVRDVEGAPQEVAWDGLGQKLRLYIHHSLSQVHASFLEMGQRTALTQLGDPDLQELSRALEEMDAAGVKALAEEAIQRCAVAMPRPDLNSRVLLLPGDGQERVLTTQMHGVIGISMGSQVLMLFLWPVEGWQQWLGYTVCHEYAHLVRNLLFPRGLSGGHLVYLKTQEPETLLDAMIAEGVADTFAMELNPSIRPAWVDALSPQAQEQLWPRVHRRLAVSDPSEIRRILFGDSDRIPLWAGYAIGYRMVQRYLELHPRVRPAGLMGLTGATVYEAVSSVFGDAHLVAVEGNGMGGV